jgi:putative intracellular protease/amidase
MAQTLPTVTIVASDGSAAERNRDPGSFRVTRTGATTSSLTVRYTGSGSATITADFTGPTGSVVIPAGQASANIMVTPVDDVFVEGNENVIVTLTANSTYVVGTAKAASVMIADNDTQRPVLIVIPNNDFYYTEYATPRRELELAGIPVVVGAGRRVISTPHAGTGQGSSSGNVMPDTDLASARATHFSAIVFVGGWGACQYQYAFPGIYNNAAYNATPAIRTEANRLINEFVAQNKYVCGICHGVSDLAWARVNGVSPVRGRRVTTAAFNSPANNMPAATEYRWHSLTNGAAEVFVGGAYGNPACRRCDRRWPHHHRGQL